MARSLTGPLQTIKYASKPKNFGLKLGTLKPSIKSAVAWNCNLLKTIWNFCVLHKNCTLTLVLNYCLFSYVIYFSIYSCFLERPQNQDYCFIFAFAAAYALNCIAEGFSHPITMAFWGIRHNSFPAGGLISDTLNPRRPNIKMALFEID